MNGDRPKPPPAELEIPDLDLGAPAGGPSDATTRGLDGPPAPSGAGPAATAPRAPISVSDDFGADPFGALDADVSGSEVAGTLELGDAEYERRTHASSRAGFPRPTGTSPDPALLDIGSEAIARCAAFGAPSGTTWSLPLYAWHVLQRRAALHREAEAAEAALVNAEAQRDERLANMATRFRDELADDARFEASLKRLAAIDRSVSTEGEALSVTEQTHERQSSGLREALRKARAEWADLDRLRQRAEDERERLALAQRRAAGQQQREEIELRAARARSAQGTPNLSERTERECLAHLDELRRAHEAAKALLEQAESAVFEAKRRADEMHDTIDDLERERQELDEAFLKERRPRDQALSATTRERRDLLAGVGRVLLEVADSDRLDEGELASLRHSDAAVFECAQVAELYRRAVGSEDGGAVRRGLALTVVFFGALALLIVLLAAR